MCRNAASNVQLEQMIEQLDDHVALEYRWSHKIAHTARDAGLITAAEKLHTVQDMLAEVRACLAETKLAIETDSLAAPANEATAHLV